MSDTIFGRYVTLERITEAHIPLLLRGLDLPRNNEMLDLITGIPYIYNEEDLSDHIFGSLRTHPDLNIFAVKADQSRLGPPSPSKSSSHSSVLGICGYRLNAPARVIRLDDLIYSPVLQRTYASTEVHYLLLCHIFEAQATKINRLWLTLNSNNIRSRVHIERLGYRYEGTFRKDNITRFGTTKDSDCLSMLDDEWPENKRVLERWMVPDNFDGNGKQIKGLGEVRALLMKSSL